MKNKEQVEKVISFLKRQKEYFEADGHSLNPTHRISIQLDILVSRKNYSHFSNEVQEIESVAYDTKEWLKGEYYDSDEELFGEGVNEVK